ncbi:MAG: proton-conducting transporter membrane subunit [Candidatus Omnitrophota bacterium]|nr:proton-conducting transporter membrane subunit [Candidatus Omnitrophota bacterium]
MMELKMNLLPFFVTVPLAAAFFIPIIGKRMKVVPKAISIVSTLFLSMLGGYTAYLATAEKILIYNVGGWPAPVGISMVVDGFSAFILVIVNTIASLVAVYSAGYIGKYTDTWKFFTLFMLMVAGMNGVLIAGDLFNLYVCLEIAAIAAYSLVAFGVKAEELEAAFKYAVMGAVGSSFMLLGLALLYGYTSTLNMAQMASVIAAKGTSKIIPMVSALFLMGFGLKAALVPFHAWLPDAHSSAPAPISAMLSGLLIKVLGIYVLSRVFFNVFGMNAQLSAILITLAVVSMVMASILAFGQYDIKRLLAYSSISQMGYIALGLGVCTPLSIMGAIFHLFNHSIFKTLLFLNAGAVEDIAGTRDLMRMPGILARSPVTGCTNLIGSMSICGIPPLGGFWSKLIIIFACIQADRPVLSFIAIAVSIMTLGYYFKAVTPILFGSKEPRLISDSGAVRRLPALMAIPMIILAILSIFTVLVLLPNMGRIFLDNAAAVLIKGKEYAALAASGAMR